MTDSPKDRGERSTPALRPLTRRSKTTGETYYRRPEVEQRINEALSLTRQQIQSRLAERDDQSAGYLKDECLVYLIRESFRRGDGSLALEISEALALRCMDYIKQYLRRHINPEYLEDCRNDVLIHTFELINDIESDRADYLEVSFRHFLKRLSADAVQKYGTSQKREQVTDSFDERIITEEGSVASVAEPSKDFRAEMFDRIQLEESLLMLPPHIRAAFVLHYLENFPIESDDPEVPTLAGHFGKTPRTVRNWLKQGVQIVTSGAGEKR